MMNKIDNVYLFIFFFMIFLHLFNKNAMFIESIQLKYLKTNIKVIK